MKIEMKRVFGTTTLILSRENVNSATETMEIIKTMLFLMNEAETGPHIHGDELRKRREAILAEGNDDKIPQGGNEGTQQVRYTDGTFSREAIDVPGIVGTAPHGPGPLHKIEDVLPELDTKGHSWDARYHSTNKAKTKDGRWKIRKNMSEAEKTEAEALYR